MAMNSFFAILLLSPRLYSPSYFRTSHFTNVSKPLCCSGACCRVLRVGPSKAFLNARGSGLTKHTISSSDCYVLQSALTPHWGMRWWLQWGWAPNLWCVTLYVCEMQSVLPRSSQHNTHMASVHPLVRTLVAKQKDGIRNCHETSAATGTETSLILNNRHMRQPVNALRTNDRSARSRSPSTMLCCSSQCSVRWIKLLIAWPLSLIGQSRWWASWLAGCWFK